jgi:hypothetical protein
LGRPKGKTKYAISLSLTKEQIEFLRRQKNASELVGKIIDDLRAVDGIDLREDYVKIVGLKQQLDALTEKYYEVRSERDSLLSHNDIHFKRVLGAEDPYGRWKDYWIENLDDPEPLDDDGRIVKRVWLALGEKVKAVESEMARVKAELLGQSQSG